MFFRENLPFIEEFITELDQNLRAHSPEKKGLSHKQKGFLSFCLMGIFVTNSVCWARFERASLGGYAVGALSWMFRHAPIPWDLLLHMGIRIILRKYNIKNGVLVVDDTDHKRSKVTSRIHRAYKVFDKKTNGYFNGQTIVFLILVSESITIPVGFAFYSPDPAWKAWKKEDKRLIALGVAKKCRPPEPTRPPEHPTKEQIAINLMEDFAHYHSEFKVKSVNGDNHYSTSYFMNKAEELFDCQTLGSMKANQNVCFRGKTMAVRDYFKINLPIKRKLKIRGGEEEEVFVASARLDVPSHGKKRFVIALRYTDQDEFTYVCASNLTWRTIDILETWTLRWLVEVFIEDFKVYEGWGQLAKQQGVEGSSRSLVLSLLCDLALFLHPSQEASIENKRPAFTVGSLLRKVRTQALLLFLKTLIVCEEGHQKLELLVQKINEVFELKPSTKHMSGRNLGRMEPTPSLKRRAVIP